MPKLATQNSRLERLCAEKGLRMTGQRRTIARVLSEAEDHPDVEEVYRRASAVDPRISLSTVYRTVRLFESEGILERHEFGDGRARYEPAGHGHHDHLINVKTAVISFANESSGAGERCARARLSPHRPPARAVRRAGEGCEIASCGICVPFWCWRPSSPSPSR
jgi:Fur family ferric uptake transcriptional regulator